MYTMQQEHIEALLRRGCALRVYWDADMEEYVAEIGRRQGVVVDAAGDSVEEALDNLDINADEHLQELEEGR